MQLFTDHGFGERGHDLPHDALDDLCGKPEHTFDLIGREAEGLEPFDDRVRRCGVRRSDRPHGYG